MHAKTLTDVSATLLEAFEGLKKRVERQDSQSVQQVKKGDRKTSSSVIDTQFAEPLAIFRAYGTSHAVIQSWDNMAWAALFLTERVSSLPSTWPDTSPKLDDSWLHSLELAAGRQPEDIVCIKKKSSIVSDVETFPYYLVTYKDGTYIDSCMEGRIGGVPCRHYWAAWISGHIHQFSMAAVDTHW